MRWMKLELIIQNEVSQKEKHQYSILTHVRQQKRHRCKEQIFGLWEKARVGCLERIALKHVYYHM